MEYIGQQGSHPGEPCATVALRFAVRPTPHRVRFGRDGLMAWMRAQRGSKAGDALSVEPGVKKTEGSVPRERSVQGESMPQNAFWGAAPDA